MGYSSLLDGGTVRRLFHVLVLMLVAASSGCGSDVPAARLSSTDLAGCDITTSACQRGIYLAVAESLDADGYLMPSIRTISVDQHGEEVRSGLDLNDLTGEDAETRGLRLMGFILPASDSLTATQVEYWITQIAAYYSGGSNSVTVIDRDYEPGVGQFILAHEFVHSIQDSQFGLNTVYGDANTEDRVMGVRSVIEGDADHSALAWFYDAAGYRSQDIDWGAVHASEKETLEERAADPEVALLDTASSFPYSYGSEFMTNLTLAEGLAGRTVAFGSPPESAAEVMRGYGNEPPTLDFPGVAHPDPVEGNEPSIENRLGAWYVYGTLRRQGMEHDEALEVALGWVGDELAIYEDGDEVIAVWRVRFEDEASAALVSDGINGEGDEGARTAVAFGDDAFVFAAERSDTLLAWAEQPLDSMTASIVPKSRRAKGGAISAGTCLKTLDVSVPMHPLLLR